MMQSLYGLANGELAPGLDPLARAAAVSFGFVFIHPFGDEVRYLDSYDTVVRAVNERFDIQGSVLASLVRMAYQNGGSLSKHRRKQYEGRVDPNALDYIDEQMKSLKV